MFPNISLHVQQTPFEEFQDNGVVSLSLNKQLIKFLLAYCSVSVGLLFTGKWVSNICTQRVVDIIIYTVDLITPTCVL